MSGAGEGASRLALLRSQLAERVPQAAPGPGVAPIEGAGFALGRENARLLDEVSLVLFADAAQAEPTLAREVALAGVGSYGRGAVALKSDLDLRVLTPHPERAAPLVDRILYPLWDLGIALGHQVVSPTDLIDAARHDLPTATSLLDWRHVAGDSRRSEDLKGRAEAGVFALSELPRFIERLEAEVEARHERFGGSVYLLEPDVKNGPGGLRDLDVGSWAARARYGSLRLTDLVRVGALTQREAGGIGNAAEFLWRLRNMLHALAGRRSDRLTFQAQEALAPRLGFGEGGEAVERMMSEYYRAARTLSRALEMMLDRAKPSLARRRPHEEDLGDGVRAFDGAVTVESAADLRARPALALRAVAVAVERGAPLLPFARDAIARAAAEPAFGSELRKSREAAELFVSLVSSCKDTKLRAGTAIRELHDLGLLLAMLPEFSPVVGRVHHDAYHVYTVDVHSVAAVDRLAELVRGELAAEFPLASRLAAEAPRKPALFLATLLHDIGKVIGGRDHSERGARMSEAILGRLGMHPDDIDEACHLIAQHLHMYHVATRRDLDDPAVIADFCRVTRSRHGLRNLYLLTVADLSTTSPTSMTSWKARMLDDLFLRADEHFASGGDVAHDLRAERVRREALELANGAHISGGASEPARAEFISAFVASMPERYILANAPSSIVAHANVAFEHCARRVLETDRPSASVSLVPSRYRGAAELCIIADDRPGLLAAITAAIAAARLEVHAAEIHSRKRAEGETIEAVDLFWVRDRSGDESAVARALPKLRRDLEALLDGRVDGPALAGARARSSPGLMARATPPVTTQVSIDNRASLAHSVVEVVCRDRPGVLFTIADCLHRLGLSIALAKITTEGTRVADVFYVHGDGGSKLDDPARSREVQAALTQALEGLEREGNAA